MEKKMEIIQSNQEESDIKNDSVIIKADTSEQEDDNQENRGIENEYDVVLTKGIYGYGILFASYSDKTVVDTTNPFYMFPNGEMGPGEKCEIIRPGDQLIKVNNIDVSKYSFQKAVSVVKNTPEGPNILTFLVISNGYQSSAINKNRSEFIETTKVTSLMEKNKNLTEELIKVKFELERERNCRQLSVKRLAQYRAEIIRIGCENSTLRNRIHRQEMEQQKLESYLKHSMIGI